MKEIILTKGKIAIVDDEDFEELNKFKWCAFKFGKVWRAFRGTFINKKQRIEYMHHRILPCPHGMQIDHINGDGLDNRRSNLRIATVSQNQHNVGKCIDNRSGYKGVRKHRNKWQAFIIIQKKFITIGDFTTPEEANTARKEYADRVLGEYSGSNRS